MLTPDQIRTIKIAQRQVGMPDEQYRLMLANVGGVSSCKLLNNESLEDCMAILEDMGFRQRGEREDYWRDKVAKRSRFANARMLRKIRTLCEESAKLGVGYPLPGLVNNMTSGRTGSPCELTPTEAWKVIEMLKAVIARAS